MLLADAEAVTITRDPTGIARAFSVASVLLIALIAAVEPLAGALVGAFARKPLLELMRDYLSAAGK